MNKKQINALLKEMRTAARFKQFNGLAAKLSELPATPAVLDDKQLKETFVWCGLSKDLELVKAFLSFGLPINTVFKGYSILGVAVRVPFPEFMQELLKLGADPDHLDSYQASPLTTVAQMAVKYDGRDYYLPSMKELAERSTRINTPDMEGNTPLDYCIRGYWDEGALLLLEHGALISACSRNGSALIEGTLMSVDVLTAFLQQVEAPAMAEQGPKAMEQAAMRGRVRHVEALLAVGVSDRLPDGSSALTVAKEKDEATRAYLEKEGFGSLKPAHE